MGKTDLLILEMNMDKVIQRYGFNTDITIAYCTLCEKLCKLENKLNKLGFIEFTNKKIMNGNNNRTIISSIENAIANYKMFIK
jgi:hypothetical protein